MKIARLLIAGVLPALSLTVAAQTDNTPEKNDFTVAATVGYNSFANATAMPGNLTDYELAAPSTQWNDRKLMVGFEGGWFFHKNWKLNLGGGMNFTNAPGYTERPGTIDNLTGTNPDDLMGEIPNYRAVASQYSCTYNVYLGIDRHFNTAVSNLQWHVGLRAGFAYALNEQKFDEWTSMGKSCAETWNLRGSVNMGVDYYVLPAMYVGFELEPFQYTHGMATVKPQPGLAALQADNNNFAIFAAPTLKLGFKF